MDETILKILSDFITPLDRVHEFVFTLEKAGFTIIAMRHRDLHSLEKEIVESQPFTSNGEEA